MTESPGPIEFTSVGTVGIAWTATMRLFTKIFLGKTT
jgi:hypothetical protein